MKRLFPLLLSLLVIFSHTLPVSAEEKTHSAVILVDDAANLLTGQQRTMLLLQNVEAEFPLTVIISTVQNLNGSTPKQVANERYDALCSSENGILLLLAMDSRDWYMLTVGEVHSRISDRQCQEIAERFLPELSAGRYYDAFLTFLNELPGELENSFAIMNFLIAPIVGIVVGGIVILIMRGAMNTAKPQRSATGYVKDGTFKLHKSFDFYLYSRVSKTPRPKSNSSGGGSSRGGSGGKF